MCCSAASGHCQVSEILEQVAGDPVVGPGSRPLQSSTDVRSQAAGHIFLASADAGQVILTPTDTGLRATGLIVLASTHARGKAAGRGEPASTDARLYPTRAGCRADSGIGSVP